MAEHALDRTLKRAVSGVAVVGLLLGGLQFLWTQALEARKPYLEKKLAWCEQAVETASFLATTDPPARGDKTQRFWQLYWGVMILVENDEVTTAMNKVKDALVFGESPSPLHESNMLRSATGELARACRQEMANSWSRVWRRQ